MERDEFKMTRARREARARGRSLLSQLVCAACFARPVPRFGIILDRLSSRSRGDPFLVRQGPVR